MVNKFRLSEAVTADFQSGIHRIRVIKAAEKHIPAIKELWVEFLKYSEEFHPVFAIRQGAADHMEKMYLRPSMNDKMHQVLLALEGQKAVAYAVAKINEQLPIKNNIKTATIEHLFVTHDFRRQGIGGQMYKEILKWFKAKGVNRIELQVIAKNKAACSFWKKQGYGDFEYIWELNI